jgi:hypothetical protein
MTKEQIVAFLTGPKAQTIERAFLSASGWGGLHIVQWFGISTTQLSTLDDILIQATPFAIAALWDLGANTYYAIVDKAAQILADRQHPAAPAIARAADDIKGSPAK